MKLFRALTALLVTAAAGCGDAPATAPVETGEGRVVALTLVGGGDQRILAGRRSPEPVRVRALDDAGAPVPGVVVTFSLEGAAAVLSQPRALTDSAGVAETFLLDPRSGDAVLTAASGGARTSLELHVERAPGELRFAAATGAVGLPGHPHPDSVVRVRVLDTEGRPLEGVEVWFAGHRRLSTPRDTSDAEGWATTVVRQAELWAGEGRIYAFLLDFPELTTTATRPVGAAARRVVLVSVDGLRGDAVERYAPPTLSRLAAEGAFTPAARTVTPSLTTPAHLSLLSGVGPDQHGNWSEEITFTPRMADLDPLFRTAATKGTTGRAFMARGGPLEGFELALRCKLAFGLDSLTLVEPSATRITEAAGAVLEDEEVRLVFLHLPDPDLAGHAHGFESPAYRDAVLRVDSALATVVGALGEDDLLVLTSDHGGGGDYGPHQHGSAADADMNVPLLLWGARVPPGRPDEASILDVAPTVLWALGLRVPNGYEGRILLDSFR